MVMRMPAEFGNPATCFMHGQAYLAQTSIGLELADNERVKVFCVRSETIDGSVGAQPNVRSDVAGDDR